MKRSKILKNAKRKLKKIDEFVFIDFFGKAFFVKNTSKGPWLYRWHMNNNQWVSLREIESEAELEGYRKQKAEPNQEAFYHQLHKQYSPKF